MEISAMIMCLVAVGPVGDLFQDALRTDRPWADAWAPWADLGLLVGITQALFWTSLWQMRKHDSGAAKPTVGSAS
jgi:hypothetical protein